MKQLTAAFFRYFFGLKPFKPTFFGFYKRVIKPFGLFNGVTKQIEYRQGVMLNLDLGDWIQQNLYFLREYEEKEIRFLENYLKAGDTFIDVGANIGLYSLLAAKMVGNRGRVFAFEPLKRNHEALLRHVQLNKADIMVVEKLAVTDQPGTLELHLNEAEGNNGMATAFSDTFTSREIVPAIVLDAYFAEKINAPVALIKLDIEGGEFPALQGMQGILKKYKPAILIEIDPKILAHTPFSPEAIEAFLQETGYQKFYLEADGNLVPNRPPAYNSQNYVFR